MFIIDVFVVRVIFLLDRFFDGSLLHGIVVHLLLWHISLSLSIGAGQAYEGLDIRRVGRVVLLGGIIIVVVVVVILLVSDIVHSTAAAAAPIISIATIVVVVKVNVRHAAVGDVVFVPPISVGCYDGFLGVLNLLELG